MNFTLIGVNHKTAPIELREELSVDQENIAAFIEHLLKDSEAEQVVPLFTCNRVEIYASAASDSLLPSLKGSFSQYHGKDISDADWLYSYDGAEALEHLFLVSSSLDSMIVGEPQILSQVKNAYFVAKELGATGKYLNFIFQKCFKAAKEIRTKTAIASSKVSIASVAADLAQETLGDLSDKTALIVGSGKIGSAFATYLADSGIHKIYIASRSYSHAEDLANRVGGEETPLHTLDGRLNEVDLVVGCTSARKPFLHRERCQAALENRNGKPLLVIDLGVPRNVAPGVGNLDGIHLYNIDQLEDVVASNRNFREAQAEHARKLTCRLADKTFDMASRLDEIPSNIRR